MVLIIPILIVNVIFVIIAFGINKKNAKYLLAGYNENERLLAQITSSRELFCL